VSKAYGCIAVMLLIGGCRVTGDPMPPRPNMPAAFAEAASIDARLPTDDWWMSFASPELASLIPEALDTNPDRIIAAEVVREAELQVHLAGASLFPALNFGADSAHSATHMDGGSWKSGNSSAVTLAASYEVDLWGRIQSTKDAAEAILRASRFDRETVRLTIVSGVADAYFQVLSLRERLAIVRANLNVAERVLAVVASRVRNGAATPLDLARQQAAVLTQRAAIPSLELQERQLLFALALLEGRGPEGFDVAGSGLNGLAVPRVAAGLPAALLTRRPDLASAEAQLEAANANVAVARAALLPNIELTGSAGLISTKLFNVLQGPTSVLAVGASLLQPIFDGGALRDQVNISLSRERSLVATYHRVIFAALSDVESALATGSRSEAQEVLQQQVVAQSRRALQLAEIRYREGADDLLVALDAQRVLFQAEDQLAQLRLARLRASIGLYRALGGGWESPKSE
jgi:multidrug efflux system outer membrane protein